MVSEEWGLVAGNFQCTRCEEAMMSIQTLHPAAAAILVLEGSCHSAWSPPGGRTLQHVSHRRRHDDRQQHQGDDEEDRFHRVRILRGVEGGRAVRGPARRPWQLWRVTPP